MRVRRGAGGSGGPLPYDGTEPTTGLGGSLRPAKKILKVLDANTRVLASAVTVLVMLSTLVAVRHELPVTQPSALATDQNGNSPSSTQPGSSTGNSSPTSIPSVTGTTPGATSSGFTQLPGGKVRGPDGIIRKLPLGIDYKNKTIKIVFYWNDSSQASPYLKGSGQEGNLDDGAAFDTYIKYINKHANGGATLMGFPFNLHGFKILPDTISNVGKPNGTDSGGFDYWIEEIIKNKKPFAAFSARSSPSAYLCPPLAKAGIFNFGTYDFYVKPGLGPRFNGFCHAFGLSFEKQVDLTVAYLKEQQKTVSSAPSNPGPRVYGFLYAAYKGLIQSAPKVIDRLKAAGIKIVVSKRVAPDLATAQTQMKAVVDAFNDAGVNTVIFPDAGSPLNFTAAATARQYFPDYYVWPCSGQDATGFVRLLGAQWARASGVTCYDDTFDSDLTNDDAAHSSEWYRHYREITNDEPPAAAPLVYAQLLPILVGLTAAGPNFFTEDFKAGLDRFKEYRYNGFTGKTTAPGNIMVDYDRDGSIWADVAKVRWNPTAPRPGGAAGAYEYTDSPPRRYRAGDSFS
jgi:substrate-binding family protein